jgi:hypothetical protein
MIRMLLTERTIRICQYWTYGHCQGGVPGLGLTDGNIGLLRGGL